MSSVSFNPQYYYGAPTTPAEQLVIDANCDCDCGFPTKTFAEMRQEVLIAMGYSAQLASPPPSVAATINFQLNLQQRLVLQDVQEITSARYFSWAAAAGQTKFCPTDNLETCRKILAATRISEVYIIRDGNLIERLTKGIEFIWKTANNPASIPSHYAVSSCIEIWPAPTEAMLLVAKGTLGHVQMVEDADTTIADPDMVVLRTVAFLKAQKGHEDAQIYMGQYRQSLGLLNSEQHIDMRYIPGRGHDGARDDILTHVMQRRVYET